MKRVHSIALTISLLGVLAAGPAAAQFEGEADLKITSKDMSGTGKSLIGKAGLRQELEMHSEQAKAGGPGVIKMTTLMRFDQPDLMYQLNDAKKSYAIIDFKRLKEMGQKTAKHDEDTYKVEKQGKDKVAGYACEKARVTSSRGSIQDYCVSGDILGSAGWLRAMRREQDAGGLMKAFKDAGLDGFPLRVVSYDRNGKDVVSTMEFTRLEKRSVPASAFEIPAGYKEESLAGTMMSPDQQKQMSDAMEKLTPEQRKMVEEMMKKQKGGS